MAPIWNFDHLGCQPDERYAGVILNANGSAGHYLFLLPCEGPRGSHPIQQEWAQSVGGELPTRSELALMFANLSAEFQDEIYWSCEVDGARAWVQLFSTGEQGLADCNMLHRARAVRRVAISQAPLGLPHMGRPFFYVDGDPTILH